MKIYTDSAEVDRIVKEARKVYDQRDERLAVEFGGKGKTAVEYLLMKDFNAVEDGKIEIIGPDIENLPPGITSLPFAFVIEVAGRKMQKDFEPILERQIHRFSNYAMGIMHVGQRDMIYSWPG